LHVHAESNRPQKRCLNQTDRDITNWFVFLLTIRRYAAIIYQQQVQVKGVEMDVIFDSTAKTLKFHHEDTESQSFLSFTYSCLRAFVVRFSPFCRRLIFITQISGHEFQGAAQAGWGANAG